jgi:hypothetical protein
VPAAPQGIVVPSVAAFSLQPTMVAPQFVTGQAFSAQVAMPQMLAPQFVTSQALMAAPSLTAQSSGLSARQLAEALKIVAESQSSAGASAESTCGGDTASRLQKLQADIDSLTATSESILKMIKTHEGRLQALEAPAKDE